MTSFLIYDRAMLLLLYVSNGSYRILSVFGWVLLLVSMFQRSTGVYWGPWFRTLWLWYSHWYHLLCISCLTVSMRRTLGQFFFAYLVLSYLHHRIGRLSRQIHWLVVVYIPGLLYSGQSYFSRSAVLLSHRCLFSYSFLCFLFLCYLLDSAVAFRFPPMAAISSANLRLFTT
jgi:hypothetical protein